MSEVLTEVHASKVGEWLGCPQKASYNFLAESKAIDCPTIAHVGNQIGNQVHKEITGHAYTPSDVVTYDEITRNGEEMMRHSKSMAKSMNHAMDSEGWRIIESEIELSCEVSLKGLPSVKFVGTIDAIVRTPGGRNLLIDFKTGKRDPADVWTQIAIYSWLLAEHEKIDDIHGVGFIWTKRDKLHQHPTQYVIDACPSDFVESGRRQAFHVAYIIASDAELYHNPSQSNCSLCTHPSCHMRVGEVND